MKKRLPAFLAGMLTTALVCGLTLSALAANGLLTIDVDPSVTIKVNGEVFQPKNEQGEDVMVFKYGGTTYAPVRALAEAYGLKVGFDQSTNMATVDAADAVVEPTTPPDAAVPPTDYSDWTLEEEAAYQEFKGMWEINILVYIEGKGTSYTAKYQGSLTEHELYNYLYTMTQQLFNKFSVRLMNEMYIGTGRLSIMFYSSNDVVVGRSDILEWGSMSGSLSSNVKPSQT